MGSREDGFTYLSLLFMIIVMGITLSMTAEVLSTAQKREKEEEFLFRGKEFREAIRRYYEEGPGVKGYPRELKHLIKDPRYPGTKRHLRRIYPDPMTGKADWEAIKEKDGTIKGVRSKSRDMALKVDNFPPEFANFTGKTMYNEWEFVYEPRRGAKKKEGER